ncbi:MAG TPA: HAD-IA family hydrolase [Burkholderiaceae bacterium]|nr:HAD-IA family hydrolase [Burkholderiaceae bacterium]
MTATRPTGLLLDFGSVISISLFERISDVERALGLPAGAIGWRGPLVPAADPLWAAMQRDELSERDYWAQRAAEIGALTGAAARWTMPDLLARLRHDDPDVAVRPQALATIRAARTAGLKVGILSNELELFYGAAFMRRLSVLREIDCLVDATHTGILKPDPRAYRQAADAMVLEPGRILFVDDQFRNIAGAHRFGMQTQFFDLRDPAGMYAAIAARLRIDVPGVVDDL